jgi:superfamily I DNA and/or RNA helicase
MVGKEVTANFPARRLAEKRIKEARLIFSTCAGAGLGLLRKENFDVVLVDEASQQTEPQTLIPLVKSISRAILVGDHVQLRATVQKHAVLTGFDISLFERHYDIPERPGVAKVMLDTQYRMHRSICDFSSTEFYEGRLRTAVADLERPLPPSQFPWPTNGKRMVFVECAAPEDLGRQSKSNKGQADLCKRIVQLLNTPSTDATQTGNESTSFQIGILTGYNRQKDALIAALPNIEVASVDGFQGREADIIIYVTVRSNLSGELGFLTDMRRLNVVMTRGKAGIILIGNRATLTGRAGVEVEETKKVWARLVGRCAIMDGVPDVNVPVKSKGKAS